MLTTLIAFLLGSIIGQALFVGGVIIYYWFKAKIIYEVKPIYFVPLIGAWHLADYGL